VSLCVKEIVPAAVSTTAMSVVLYLAGIWLEQRQWPAGAKLVALILAGALVYCGTAFALFGKRLSRYIRFLRGLRNGQENSAEALNVA